MGAVGPRDPKHEGISGRRGLWRGDAPGCVKGSKESPDHRIQKDGYCAHCMISGDLGEETLREDQEPDGLKLRIVGWCVNKSNGHGPFA